MAQARRRKHLKKTACLIVDYLQIMGGDGRQAYPNRVQEVTAITSGLKALAKALDIPVIVLSQLSRQVENRDDRRPQLSDLRDSGSIEQDADVVLFVWEEYYVARREPPASQASAHLELQDELKAVQGLAEIIVAKHRHGPIGTVKLAFSAHALDENRDQGGAERPEPVHPAGEKRWQGRDRDRVCGLDAGCREAFDPGLRFATHGGKEVDAAQGALVDGRA